MPGRQEMTDKEVEDRLRTTACRLAVPVLNGKVLARPTHTQSDRGFEVLWDEGYVPASKAGAELLFDVIATAYERNSLVLTTNLPFENWTEVLGSERLTGAALDRLTHRCHILETKGESYRLQDAKRRRRRE